MMVMRPLAAGLAGAILVAAAGPASAADAPADAAALPFVNGFCLAIVAADDLGVVEAYEPGGASHRELLLHVGVYERMIREFNGGEPVSVTVKTTIDAPAGSGLGSSSALVVALVEGFRAILGAPISKY